MSDEPIRFQHTIYGTVESAGKNSTVAELIEKAIPEMPPDADSRQYVWAAWLKSERTQAFIQSVPRIATVKLAFEEYCSHLFENNCFESFARAARPSMRNSNGTRETPKWYEDYLQSPHWRRMKFAVNHCCGSCVACNRATDLHVHHRHYDTLGNESIDRDLTLLCGSCHITVHRANPGLHPATEKPAWLVIGHRRVSWEEFNAVDDDAWNL